MAAGTESFRIEPEELDLVLADVARSERVLGSLIAELEAELQRLHVSWHGLAAVAQGEAQQEWERGFAAMAEALGSLRRAGRTAHANYTGAASANVSMWAMTR